MIDARVINLDRRDDRLATFTGCADAAGLRFVRTQAVDAAVDNPTRPGWLASPAALANALSHQRALASMSTPCRMVFEDDAVPGPDFLTQLDRLRRAAPDDWTLLLLGGQIAGLPGRVGENVYRLTGFIRTHAYLVRGAGITMIERAITTAQGHWDGRLGHLAGRSETAYFSPLLRVGVSGSVSDIPDSSRMTERTARLGSGYGSYVLDPPCRLGQRNDGLGPNGHARLQGFTSTQLPDSPRVSAANRYDGVTNPHTAGGSPPPLND